MATALPTTTPPASLPASQGFFKRQWATVADSFRRTFLVTPTIRIGLIGPGAAGKTTFIWELLHVAIEVRRPEIGISLVGVNLPEWFNRLRSYPGRTITPVVLYDGPTHLLGKRGQPVQFTVVDSQGQLFRTPTQNSSGTDPNRKQILNKMQTVNLLILMLDPVTLGYYNNTQDYNPFRTFVDSLLEHNPSAAVAVVYSQADEYGVPLLDSDVHLLCTAAEETALETYRKAEAGQRATAWKTVLQAVASGSSSMQAGELRRWLVDQSRLLWDLILEMPRRPLYLRAYLANARPVGFRDPNSAGDFREAFEPHHRRGVLQVFADFLAVYRTGLGQRRWRFIGVVVGFLLLVIVLGYGFLPGLAVASYQSVPTDLAKSPAQIQDLMVKRGLDKSPTLLPGSSDIAGRHLVLTRINGTYAQLVKFLCDRIESNKSPQNLGNALEEIANKLPELPPEMARETALLDPEKGDIYLRGLKDKLAGQRDEVAKVARALKDIATAKESNEILKNYDKLRKVLGIAHEKFDEPRYFYDDEKKSQWDGLVAAWVVAALEQIVKSPLHGTIYLNFLRTLDDNQAQPFTNLGGNWSNPYSFDLIKKCHDPVSNKWKIYPPSIPAEVEVLDITNWEKNAVWNKDVIGVEEAKRAHVTGGLRENFPESLKLTHFEDLVFKRTGSPKPADKTRLSKVYFRHRMLGERYKEELNIELPTLILARETQAFIDNQGVKNWVTQLPLIETKGVVAFVPSNMIITALEFRLNDQSGEGIRYTPICRGNDKLWLPAVLAGLEGSNNKLDKALVLKSQDNKTSEPFVIPKVVQDDLKLLRIIDPFEMTPDPSKK